MAIGRPRCAKCKQDLPWIVNATANDFDEAIERSTLPVLVDLWAPWCGPCKMVAPMLERLAAERSGKLRVVKLNVDEAPAISARLRAQSIPTLLLFDRGVEVGRQIGALPEDALRRWIDQTFT
ncbi:MAG: thioredoxin [Acidimicrobiales bacterium]